MSGFTISGPLVFITGAASLQENGSSSDINDVEAVDRMHNLLSIVSWKGLGLPDDAISWAMTLPLRV